MEYYKNLRALVRHWAAQWFSGYHEGRGFAPTRRLGLFSVKLACSPGLVVGFLWVLWLTCSLGELGTGGVNVGSPEWDQWV